MLWQPLWNVFEQWTRHSPCFLGGRMVRAMKTAMNTGNEQESGWEEGISNEAVRERLCEAWYLNWTKVLIIGSHAKTWDRSISGRGKNRPKSQQDGTRLVSMEASVTRGKSQKQWKVGREFKQRPSTRLRGWGLSDDSGMWRESRTDGPPVPGLSPLPSPASPWERHINPCCGRGKRIYVALPSPALSLGCLCSEGVHALISSELCSFKQLSSCDHVAKPASFWGWESAEIFISLLWLILNCF